MLMSDVVDKVHDVKWSFNNSFSLAITAPRFQIGNPSFTFDENINLNVVSIQTPDISSDPVDVFVNSRWYTQIGRNALYRFSITFRDQDQLSLYKKFLQIYFTQKNNYPEDVGLGIVIYKDADWMGQTSKFAFSYETCLIEGISNVDLNNESETQIAQFTVSFKCDDVKLIDEAGYTNSALNLNFGFS